MIEGYSFFIKHDGDLLALSYEDVVVGVNGGTIHPDTKLLMYHNFDRDKHYVKAKTILKW
jgi:hypothetical protein